MIDARYRLREALARYDGAMPRKPPEPPAQPKPLSRAEWVATFANIALELWPEVGLRHANTVGLSRWVTAPSSDPAAAAMAWIAEARGTRSEG